ncbi:hypothetical protein GCM10023220_40290 [Streptomyces ziwulingensis]|uniref:Uncharacterized protein n=1 Tax=Streptomyces ziwulingensis TaxID=1045501 RepID=A0ABP9CB49_9ACTN
MAGVAERVPPAALAHAQGDHETIREDDLTVSGHHLHGTFDEEWSTGNESDPPTVPVS